MQNLSFEPVYYTLR